MFFQVDLGIDMSALLTIGIMLFMMVLNIYFFTKKQVWVISVVILVFSIFIWVQSLSVNLPLAPLFQNFFMLFQAIIFLSVSYRTYSK